MIKAIIFDFDGVFVDSWAFHVDVMLDGSKKLGIDTTKEELTRVFFGKTLKEATVDFLKLKGVEDVSPEEFIEMKLSYDPEYVDIVPAFDKMVDFVKRNKDKYRMCVASASRRVLIEPFLEREGIVDAFEFVLDADSVTKGKPDPEVYLNALKKLGLKKEEVVIIEDSIKGVQASEGAGIFCIALTQTTAKEKLVEVGADIVLEDAGELEGVIRKLD